ncbi:hypothetical protein [Mesorhizobium sp. B2-3-5]|uniref:hypothetical protein n=1 Tax=Mesorhizobium sp. B2-3-5 TaxID=2589958 RepID=UPI00112C07C4|nr:hypothetical protein [Mesorhizobium sp. B2-3-5]TPM36643.1 hypothetical protein FJ958_02120 [Mesorhizobium sp. B2-3-5]
MQKLIVAGKIIDWRRVENRPGARLQVEYPSTISNEDCSALREGIADAEGCEPDWIEMIPKNRG